MQYYHSASNTTASNGMQFTINTTQYPQNWFASAHPNEIIDHGFIPVTTIGERKDDRFYDNAEIYTDGIITITATEKPIEHIKKTFLGEIAASRYLLETSGTAMPNGMTINTDRESQSMISGALLRVMRNPDALIDWKSDNSWFQLSKATIELIADAVSEHVQKCFTAEHTKCVELTALSTFSEVVSFDPIVTLT